MSKMLKSSGAMSAATMLSRLLGMVREIVYARFMGTGWVADAFIFAFMVPNLFRRLLGEGALTAAFVPIFKEKEIKEGEREMWLAANAVLSGLVIAASVIIGLAMLGLSVYLAVGNPNESRRLTFELMRFMFPYMLLVCIAAVFMGMLNSRGHFFIPAMGATMLNVVMISFTLWVAPNMGTELKTKVFGLAIGVLVAGIAQMLFQWPTLHKEGFRWHWRSPFGNETVRIVVERMIPGTLGVAAFQVNIFLTQGIAKWHGEGILSSFSYGVRLMELPQGVFGIALATFLLPTLTQFASQKNFPEFRSTLREGISNLIFVNGLAAVLLGVLAAPIVRLLFQNGKFTELSTLNSSQAVLGLAPGLVAFSMVNILARAFYATGDTKTPMQISIVCLLLNVLISLALIYPLKDLGLGLANSITATLNAGLLTFALRKKIGKLEWGELRAQFASIAGALLIAAVIAWLLVHWWTPHFGHATKLRCLGEVFVPAISASAVYFGLGLWLRIPAARDLVRVILRR
ncbi:murein biosynthesis integral membrane protein MurJ [bacterium]|nr:murein biosynthesis integral membrane protein MurJ [bacterium]